MPHSYMFHIMAKHFMGGSGFFLLILLLLFSISFTVHIAIDVDDEAIGKKMDEPHSSSFQETPFPSSLMFDPYEEYRHVVFDKTVIIMGNTIMQEPDKITNQTSRTDLDSEQMQLLPRAENSQPFDDMTRMLSRQELQEQQRLNKQNQLNYPRSSAEAIYPSRVTSTSNMLNQSEISARSFWFPSIPSYYCHGSYSFVIEGTAKLDSEELETADRYPVTIKILTDKLRLSSMVDNTEVAGELHIGGNRDIGNFDTLSDHGVTKATDDVGNTNTTKFVQDVHNFDIQRIENNCRIHVYNSK